jgi:hypothetical protein
MPLTAFITFFGSIVLFGSWMLIRQRIHNSQSAPTRQVVLLNQFLLLLATFEFIMFLPHLLLSTVPSQFPFYMALGYTFGHIFMYAAFLYVGRLFISVVPRLNGKDTIFMVFGSIAVVIATVINAKTMIWGTRPEFDYAHNVTLFNAHPAIGAIIGLFALVCVVPTAVLMIKNGINNSTNRLRSFMIGGGLFFLMLGGPLHDNAHTAQLYIIADVITIVAQLVVAAGIAYRIEERVGVARPISSVQN